MASSTGGTTRYEMFGQDSYSQHDKLHNTDKVEVVFGKPTEEKREIEKLTGEETKLIDVEVDYMKASSQYVVAHFIIQCCKKLEAKCITTATACSLFHKFFSKADINKYDPYLIGAACIYLAGKVEDDQLRLRDVINTVYCTLHRTLETLPLSDDYWNYRDAIVQAELFVLRMVEFRVRMTHPHKYLLHYLTSIRDWLQENEWKLYPLPRTSWAILQDMYHDPFVISCDPSILALGVLQLTLEIYGVQLPFLNGIEADRPWFQSLNSMAAKDRIWDVMTRCIQVYNKEKEALEPITVDIKSNNQIVID